MELERPPRQDSRSTHSSHGSARFSGVRSSSVDAIMRSALTVSDRLRMDEREARQPPF